MLLRTPVDFFDSLLREFLNRSAEQQGQLPIVLQVTTEHHLALFVNNHRKTAILEIKESADLLILVNLGDVESGEWFFLLLQFFTEAATRLSCDNVKHRLLGRLLN